jgi:hypothetical protein
MRTEEEVRKMIAYMKAQSKKNAHQCSKGEAEAGIACLEWVLNDKGGE